MSHGSDEGGLWGFASGPEIAPLQTKANKYSMFVNSRNKALPTIVLAVDPSLLYLLGDPQDIRLLR